MKKVIVTFSNGDRFAIPAEVFAHSRAAYYAGVDTAREGSDDFDRIYAEEYEIIMSDDSELLDWRGNNTDWDDVRDRATPIQGKPIVVNYSEEWTNVEAEVVEEADNE